MQRWYREDIVVIHDTHTEPVSSWRARRGRPGFNEDRRICPIKTSYKDPSGSALIRKTSNLDFAATAASYPRTTLQVPAYRYPSRYRYRAPPSKPSRDFESNGEADRDLWNLFRELSKFANLSFQLRRVIV